MNKVDSPHYLQTNAPVALTQWIIWYYSITDSAAGLNVASNALIGFLATFSRVSKTRSLISKSYTWHVDRGSNPQKDSIRGYHHNHVSSIRVQFPVAGSVLALFSCYPLCNCTAGFGGVLPAPGPRAQWNPKLILCIHMYLITSSDSLSTRYTTIFFSSLGVKYILCPSMCPCFRMK